MKEKRGRFPTGATGNHPVKPAFDLSQPGLIYAVGVDGLFRSGDDGQNWTQLIQPFPLTDEIVKRSSRSALTAMVQIAPAPDKRSNRLQSSGTGTP